MQTRVPSNQTTPSTQRVRARDLASALREVKGIYGEDALIVSTREVLMRGEDGLAPQKMVEVEIAESANQPVDPYTQSYQEAASATSAQPMDESVRRLDTLSARMANWSQQLGESEVRAQSYPLAQELRATGCSASTVEELTLAFEEANAGGEFTRSAARRHLSKYLRATRTLRFEQIAGEHWFLGRAGSGRTSLVLQLAGELRRVGVSVAVVAHAPSHEGDLRRLEMACEALEIPAVVTFDPQELALAREELDSSDVLLVDTPCYLSNSWQPDIPESAQRHLVVPLADGREVVREQVRQARGFEPDTVALTQMDLFPRPGRTVDLAVELDRPVSFLQGRSDGALRLRIARGESLLEAALGESHEASSGVVEVPLRTASARA